MLNTTDKDLASLAQSLQVKMDLTKRMGLDFVARLLAMALIEIRRSQHQISEMEIEALCATIEERSFADKNCKTTRVANLSERRRLAATHFGTHQMPVADAIQTITDDASP